MSPLIQKLVFSQHSPHSATMRIIFHDCLSLPRLQRRKSFVRTLLAKNDRVGLLHIIDNYRRKLPDSEGFVTATIVTPKHRSSWNAERHFERDLFLLLPPGSNSMTLSRHPVSLQIPSSRTTLSFRTLNVLSLVPRCLLILPSFPFLFDSLFPSLPSLPVRVCGGFLAPQTNGFRRQRFTFRLQTPYLFFFSLSQQSTMLKTWSHPCLSSSSKTPSSLLPYHTPWRTSTTQKKGCLERQTHFLLFSTLLTFATFSFFPFHFDIVTECAFFCKSTKASFDFFSSNSLTSSKIVS